MSQDQVLHGGQLSHSLPGVKNIIAVSSGKGGVGKSTVSVQLALALQKQGKSVGILDADVFGPSIPTLLGVTEPPRIEKKDDVEFLIPPVAYDLKVMSMGFLIDPDQALIWRGPMIHSALTQLCFQVDWGELDVLVIDMPPGTGDVQLSIAQMVSLRGVVMVSTPQEVALADVRRAFAMWDQVRVPVLGVVENMSYFLNESGEKLRLFGEGGGKRLSEKYHVPVLGEIPLEPRLRESGDLGRPLYTQGESVSVNSLFNSVATELFKQIEKSIKEGVSPSQVVQIGDFS